MEIVHHQVFLGLDVGKESVVACLLEGESAKKLTRQFRNDEAGISSLLAWLSGRGKCRAVLEATSRYHRACERALLNAGAEAELANPRRARALAIGLGLLDKDDKVDAGVLAEAARLRRVGEPNRPTLAAQDLKDHSRTIDQLKRDAADYKKRMEGLDKESAAYKACAGAVKALKALAVQEERAGRAAVKEEPETNRRYTLAKTVPDVGHVTARAVSVELPWNMGQRNTRKLTAYAGVVPRRHQSGNLELPPAISGGNAHLRTGLFMAAIHSVYMRDKRFESFYKRLEGRVYVLVRNKGGRHMKAIVAVMRKLLANILAVLKRNAPWTKEPPPRKAKQAVPAASSGEAASAIT